MSAPAAYRKKLIETAIPLDAINRESAREKSIRHGHPSTLHLWWARRPLAACRAVIFCSLIDDPGEAGAPAELLRQIDALEPPTPLPADWGSLGLAEQRRQRLFKFIARLVKWESTTDDEVIGTARELILAATGGNPPPLLDPFCGGGSIPLEAQRLGLEAHGSDLNPVAVLITKALIELPPKFAGLPPVNPGARAGLNTDAKWQGAAGLAEDVRWYGEWMRRQAWERIGHLYPQGPNGETVIAWLWARTVTCPNPACGAEMPLAKSFWLSKKQKAWVEPIAEGKQVRFRVRDGGAPQIDGTVNRSGATCVVCSAAAPLEYVRDQGQRVGLGEQLMAVVEEGDRRREYRSPQQRDTDSASIAKPENVPDAALPHNALGFRIQNYGMTHHDHLFTSRQLTALATFSNLVQEIRELVRAHTSESSQYDRPTDVYADTMATYLAFAVDRSLGRWCSLAIWQNLGDKVAQVFGRQALSMIWDFAEANPFSNSTGNWSGAISWIAKVLERLPENSINGAVRQMDASAAFGSSPGAMVVTDPPYYDNIGYANLSDFFYVWLRRTIRSIYPQEFSTMLTPKAQEMVAEPHRFDGDKRAAEKHFEDGLSRSFDLIREGASSDTPMALFYAYKQAEKQDGEGSAVSTGWETMLNGLIDSGFAVTGTWPMRTERPGRPRAIGANALASSVVLVCRPRPADAPMASLPEFLGALERELPQALQRFIGEHIAPVDLPQASIGPGMAVFSRYAAVVRPNGDHLSVREALELINEGVERFFSEQEGRFDADTQFCLRWFAQHGFDEGDYGDAENLARAKAVSVAGLAGGGALISGRGKVRLTPFERYEADWSRWDPADAPRLTAWESCHYLSAALESEGIEGAARLARRLGGAGSAAIELAYRLYAVHDSKSRSREAQRYNNLADSWRAVRSAADQLTEAEQGTLE